MSMVWTRINTLLLLLVLFALLGVIAMLAARTEGGPLDPTGPPSSTQRTSITSLPYTITQPGSYYLTADLVGVAGQNGITVGADDVTIDLNGFTLRGAIGSLDGIFAAGIRTNLTVRNGVVKDWGEEGIGGSGSEIRDALISDITVSGNSGTAIRINNGVVTNCNLVDNGAGLHILGGEHGSHVSHCSARQNAFFGFTLFGGSTIEQCTSADNGSDGIRLSFAGTVRGCVVMNNGNDGIDVTGHTLVTDNVAYSNGLGAGDGAGIHASGAGNYIVGNTASLNDRGIDVDVADNVIDRNSAFGNTTNFDFAAGNVEGIFVSPATVDTATNPYSNYLP